MSNLNIFHGPNAGYALELYERYQQDPTSVDPATRAFFDTWTPTDGYSTPTVAPLPMAETGLDVDTIVGAARLIRYIRELGHLAAHIDPLGDEPPGDPGLEESIHGVTDADLAALPASIVRGPLVSDAGNALEAVEQLRRVYAGSIGYETDHLQIFEERAWMRETIESGSFFQNFDAERKRDLL